MKVAGADVWKGRWIFVVLDDGAFSTAFVSDRFDEACATLPDAAALGVDIPIGLPRDVAARPADSLARKYVGPRWQSVFLAPPGPLMQAPTHARANELARSLRWPGVSAQTYGLRHMVSQVEAPALQDERIHEVHPEVSFARAQAGAPLRWPKTSWNGQAQRLEILRSVGVQIPSDLAGAGAAGPADVLDAAIVAWSASRIASGSAQRFPHDGPRIGSIWY